MLEKLGHEVVVGNNGREAIERLSEQDFDLVFMDVQMPEMDGMTATGKIREREQGSTAHMPIVAMTAHAMKGDKEKCIEAGMDDYISKPIRRAELSKVLQRVAERFLATSEPTPDDESDSETEESNAMILDAVALMEECDNDKDLLSRMLEIYDRDSAERLPRLRAAVESGDGEAVKAEAHALKGGISTFFAGQAYETAYKLETMGGDGDLSEAKADLATLEDQLRVLRQRLGDLVIS
ncbi:MAG: response regulator [Planctomycetes bacterium]|nr:response regulator [Planctomycetota bacterium]